MYAIVSKDRKIAIRTITGKAYTLGYNTHDQRKVWKTLRGAEKGLQCLKNLVPTNDMEVVFLSWE